MEEFQDLHSSYTLNNAQLCSFGEPASKELPFTSGLEVPDCRPHIITDFNYCLIMQQKDLPLNITVMLIKKGFF